MLGFRQTGKITNKNEIADENEITDENEIANENADENKIVDGRNRWHQTCMHKVDRGLMLRG
jgi:hypothetical protein